MFQWREGSRGGNRTQRLREKAGELGFEPRLTDPESVVLPLHHSPMGRRNRTRRLHKQPYRKALRQWLSVGFRLAVVKASGCIGETRCDGPEPWGISD